MITLSFIVLVLAHTSFSVAETIIVPCYNEDGVWSSSLIEGQWYRITAENTYRYELPNSLWADAEFIQIYDGSVREFYWNPNGFEGNEITDYGDLLIDDSAVDWLGSSDGIVWAPHTYSSNHIYRYDVLGKGSPLYFRVADQTPFGPDFTGNNSGSITLQIESIPEPATVSLLALGAMLAGRKRKS